MLKALIKSAVIDIKTFIVDTLFPISCLSCDKEGSFVCDSCQPLLTKLDHQRCIACQKATPFGLTHPGCQTPHGADGLISFYDYHDEKISKIVIGGKYYFIPAVYQILGEIIAEKIKADHSYLLSPTSLTLSPVPLHSFRKRWRGFNQAEILCQTLQKHLSLPYDSVLVRCKVTRVQKDLKKEQRIKNMVGAFKLAEGADVRGKNIILVDDVTTTGSTLSEAAKVLKRGGAAKVICLTIARD